MTIVQYGRSTSPTPPPPRFLWFKTSVDGPVCIKGLVMAVSPSITQVSTISLHPLHLRVLFSAVCV